MKGKHLHIESDSKLLVEIRKRVNDGLQLNQSSTKIKHWLKFIFYVGLSIVLYLLLYAHSSPLVFILNYITLGLTLLLFAFNFAHDFSHNAVFENKGWNAQQSAGSKIKIDFNIAFSCFLFAVHIEQGKSV